MITFPLLIACYLHSLLLPLPFMFVWSQVTPVCAVPSFPNCTSYCLFFSAFTPLTFMFIQVFNTLF